MAGGSNTYYVYAPINGEVWSLDCYCHGPCANAQPPDCGSASCKHTVVGGAGEQPIWKPADIVGGIAGTYVCFFASGAESIQVQHINNVCASGVTPWTCGVKVLMYRLPNQVCLMGTVVYGHLQNRIADGYTANRPPEGWGLIVGELPANCNCGCSDLIHTHMEFNIGSRRSSLSCNPSTYVYASSSWIYSYTWNDTWCSGPA